IGVQRFHAARHDETLWLTSGQAAAPAAMRLPIDTIAVSSRFGMRADPFDQPKNLAARGPVMTHGTGRAMNVTVNVATKRGVLAGLSPTGTTRRAVGRTSPVWYMHEGIDLVAPIGTPVYAAGDGVVTGAGPNGGYGNWVRIEHPGNFATVYGHLRSFASEVEVGHVVARGELIGFVGSTGRSTGAHLHFELISNGKPVDPFAHANFKPVRLVGADMERFRRQLSRSRLQRDLKATAPDAAASAPVPW
ncbi:MAG: M23 family metallopeptidase, partial [Reyranella sp.]